MIKIKIIIISFFLIVIFSCVTHQQDQYYINPESIKDTKVLLSDYADSISYIPLSFEIPISSIRAIDFYDDLIFIGAGTAGMLVFNKDGSFNKKIGNTGRGPGEYYSVNSFAINYKRKLIYILDAGPAAKVMAYFFDGKLKYEFSNIELDGIFQRIALLDNRLYLFEIFVAGKSTYNWVEMDLEGNILSTKPNSIPPINTMLTIYVNPIYNYQNGIGYWNQYNDTIFRIDNKTSSVRFFFAKGDFRLPKENIEESDKYFRVKQIIESDKYVWIREINSPTDNVIILNKQEGTSEPTLVIKNEITAQNGPINDFDGGLNFVPGSYFRENGYEYLVGWYNAYQLKSMLATEAFKNSTPKYPEKKKELEQLANSLDENDNPVLMLVKLK